MPDRIAVAAQCGEVQSGTHLHFDGLPREIRDNIYGYASASSSVVDVTPRFRWHSNRDVKKLREQEEAAAMTAMKTYTALTLVSHMVGAEAAEIFWKANTFQAAIHRPDDVKILQAWLAKTPRNYFRHLRHLRWIGWKVIHFELELNALAVEPWLTVHLDMEQPHGPYDQCSALQQKILDVLSDMVAEDIDRDIPFGGLKRYHLERIARLLE